MRVKQESIVVLKTTNVYWNVACQLTVFTILAVWNSPAIGQAISWANPQTGPTAGVWSTAANWSPLAVPGIANTAKINNGGEARITSSVAASRIEVGKNGGTGTITSLTTGITITTDSDFDIGEIGGSFASGPIVVNSSGSVTISDAASVNIGTSGVGDLDIGQTSATLGAQAFGVGAVTLERIPNVLVTDSVEIGKAGGSATANGQGTFVVDAVGTLQIDIDLDVGQVSGTGQATGLGIATITNTPSIIVGRGIDIGRTSGSSMATNSGTGNLMVSDATVSVGFADIFNPGSLNIGAATTTTGQVADANGIATLDRVTLSVATRIVVGELAGLGTSPTTTSDGTLNLTDSAVTTNQLDVATVVGGTAGTVQGTIHMDSSLVTLGGLTLGPNAQLEFGLAGTTKADGTGAAGQYSAINVGSATLDGNLNVFLVDGFTPLAGNTFQIISGTRTGTLNPVGLPVLSGGLAWDVQYNPASVILQVIAGLTADFDSDGDVDSLDLSIWESSFGIGAGADADGDGDSDGNDFLAWQQQFTGSVPVSATAVPEPTSFYLLSMAVVTILAGCRSKRFNQTAT